MIELFPYFAWSAIGMVGGALVARVRAQRKQLSTLAPHLFALLREGADLTAAARRIDYALVDAMYGRVRKHRSLKDPDFGREVEVALRALHALVAMERLHFDVAAGELDRLTGHPAYELLSVRLSLWSGESEITAFPPTNDGGFDPVLLDDTRAQLALRRGEAERVLAEEKLTYPSTQARLLAAVGRENEALIMLKRLAPTRLADLCRAFPGDAAVLLLNRERSPYR
jgi:hypothetical protein